MNVAAVIDGLLTVADLSRPLPEGWGRAMGPEEWKAFTAAAGRQRVLGMAACRLSDAMLAEAPDEVQKRLERARHGHRLRALAAFGEVDRIHAALAAAGIPCVPFKGADLARRVYPDAAMRPFEDLDLLVPERDLAKARHVMQGLGYREPSSLLPFTLLRRFHFHLPMLHVRTGILVELHWRLADRRTLAMPARALFEGAHPQPGAPHLVLPAEVYAVYLCAHLGKHGYLNGRICRHARARDLVVHTWSELRLIWFVDLYLLMQRHDLSPETILARARTYGGEAAALDALGLCRALFPGVQTLAPGRQTLARERPLERRVKDRLLARMCGDLDGDGGLDAGLPWLLRTNKLIHVRPVRLLDIW